jgi:hypothetical protein
MAEGKKRPCFRCDGTGEKCRACGESASVCDGNCDLEYGRLVDCEECGGYGVAPADRETTGNKGED